MHFLLFKISSPVFSLNFSAQNLNISSSKFLPPKKGKLTESKTVNKLKFNLDKTKVVFEWPASINIICLVIVGSIVAADLTLWTLVFVIKYSLYFL